MATSVMILTVQTLAVTFEVVGVSALLAPTTPPRNAALDGLVIANIVACAFMHGWWLSRSTRARTAVATVRACTITVPLFVALALTLGLPSLLHGAVLVSAVILGTTLGAWRHVATRPRFDRSTVVLAA